MSAGLLASAAAGLASCSWGSPLLLGPPFSPFAFHSHPHPHFLLVLVRPCPLPGRGLCRDVSVGLSAAMTEMPPGLRTGVSCRHPGLPVCSPANTSGTPHPFSVPQLFVFFFSCSFLPCPCSLLFASVFCLPAPTSLSVMWSSRVGGAGRTEGSLGERGGQQMLSGSWASALRSPSLPLPTHPSPPSPPPPPPDTAEGGGRLPLIMGGCGRSTSETLDWEQS